MKTLSTIPLADGQFYSKLANTVLLQQSSTLASIPTDWVPASFRAEKQGLKWNAETRVRVFACLDDGMPVDEIRRRTGVSNAVIYKWKKGWSLDLDPPLRTPDRGPSTSQNHSPHSMWDQRTYRTVLGCLDQGMTQQEVSDEMGVPMSTITQWKKENSVVKSPTRGVAWDNTIRLEASRYLALNMPVKQISHKIGVPYATISNWKREEELVCSRSAQEQSS